MNLIYGQPFKQFLGIEESKTLKSLWDWLDLPPISPYTNYFRD